MTTYVTVHEVKHIEIAKGETNNHKWTTLCAYCSDGSKVEFTLHHASFDEHVPVRGDVEFDL